MTQHYINFKQERSFGSKINATFAFISQNLKPIAKSALYIGGPFALLTTIVVQVYQYNTFSGLAGSFKSGPVSGPTDIGSSTGAIFAYVGVIYLILFAMAALTIAIAQRHVKAYVETGSASIEIGHLWRTIWRDFLSALGSSIGIGIILGAVSGFMMLPFGLIIAAVPSPYTVFLVIIALFIVILMITAALMLIYPIRNFERINFFEAIGRAFSLNSGKWWSSAGLVMIVAIIQLAILVALSIPMYVVTFLRGFHMDNPAEMFAQATELNWFTVFNALASVVYSIGFILISSIMLIAVSFQYFNLRERREASGLLERMQSFGEAPTVHEEEEQY